MWIFGFAFGLLVKIEQNLISIRIRETLAAKRVERITLENSVRVFPQTEILLRNRKYVC